VTHDQKGEYGHWQHRIVSQAVCEAVDLAADASYDPESANQFGTFQVKKLYLHLYPENTIQLDVLSPLPRFDSQNVCRYFESRIRRTCFPAQSRALQRGERGDLQPFGLWTVLVRPWPDTDQNDMFEHIEASSLSNYIPPTPTVSRRRLRRQLRTQPRLRPIPKQPPKQRSGPYTFFRPRF
jgi:hypothetical protein